MARARFYSDADEATFTERAAQLGVPFVWDGHEAAIPDALENVAIDCNGTMVQDEPTPSGADDFLDTGAFSVRSDAAKAPHASPPRVTTIFYKRTERRKTRGQP